MYVALDTEKFWKTQYAEDQIEIFIEYIESYIYEFLLNVQDIKQKMDKEQLIIDSKLL